MRRKLAFAGVLVCFALLLSGFSCSSSQFHTANRAAKQIADDLHEFEAQVEAEYNAGNLDKDEAKNLASLASQGTLADDAFVAKVKGLGKIDTSNSQQVSVWFQDLLGQIAALNDQGVLHIKDEKTKAKFALIFQSINSALTTIQLLLPPGSPEPKPAPVPPPIQQSGLDAAGIALLLAAFNSVAKLIAQARADGSLTDEALQAAAITENEDTRDHAAAFIASLESKPPVV